MKPVSLTLYGVNMDYCRLQSPISGRILRMGARPGGGSRAVGRSVVFLVLPRPVQQDLGNTAS